VVSILGDDGGASGQPKPDEENQRKYRTRSHRDALKELLEKQTQGHSVIVRLVASQREITRMLAPLCAKRNRGSIRSELDGKQV